MPTRKVSAQHGIKIVILSEAKDLLFAFDL